jgi:hypothetical protein
LTFVLPTRYRPAKDQLFPVASNHAFGEIAVFTNGNVTPYLGSTAFVSLTNISFDKA